MDRLMLTCTMMAALAVAACGGGAEEGGGGSAAGPAEDPVPDHQPVDVAELLSRAGKTSNDHLLISGVAEFHFSCEDDVWSLRAYYGLGRPPALDSMVLVAWDMPAGTFRGWSFQREAEDSSYYAMTLSAEEAGFGCKEQYTTSFFILATYEGTKVSRPAGLERAPRAAFRYGVFERAFPEVSLSTSVDYAQAAIPAPDTMTYYLQNLFTGVQFSADVLVDDDDSPRKHTRLITDYVAHGLCQTGEQIADVVACTLHKREGVEVMNSCLTVTDNTLP
jgi:hypothetical protein